MDAVSLAMDKHIKQMFWLHCMVALHESYSGMRSGMGQGCINVMQIWLHVVRAERPSI